MDVITHVFYLDLNVLQYIVAVILPMITALVTKRLAHSAWKSGVLLVLSVLAAVIGEVIRSGGAFSIAQCINFLVITYGVAIISHFGFLKPFLVTGSNGVLSIVSANTGFGRNDSPSNTAHDDFLDKRKHHTKKAA